MDQLKLTMAVVLTQQLHFMCEQAEKANYQGRLLVAMDTLYDVERKAQKLIETIAELRGR